MLMRLALALIPEAVGPMVTEEVAATVEAAVEAAVVAGPGADSEDIRSPGCFKILLRSQV